MQTIDTINPIGKSWLACALGNKACRDDFAVAYHRVPRLFTALALGRADGRYTKMLRAIARLDLLILDDWGGGTTPTSAVICLRLFEDRYEAVVIITSQLPVDRWYEIIGTPPWPTQSSIASSTTPTALNSKERASGSKSNPLKINRSLDLLIPRRHHQIDPCD